MVEDPKPPVIADTSPQIAAGLESGALLQTLHVTRQVKVYPVIDADLKAISMFNGLTTTFATVSAGFLTFGLGLVVQAIFVADGPAENGYSLQGTAEALTYVVAPICGIMCVIFAALAIWSYRSRAGLLTQIEK